MVYMHQLPGFGVPDIQIMSAYYRRIKQCLSFLYVDDIVLTASFTSLLQRIISSLHKEFAMTDLRPLNYYLGIHATRTTSDMFLSQRQYAVEIIERVGMPTCHPCRTPVEPGAKLTSHIPCVKDPTLYRSLVGSLQYLTFTRPDISYDLQQICLFMHDPREQHMHALRRIICYIEGTTNIGLQLYASSPTTLVAYSDADWVGCPTPRRSTYVCSSVTTFCHGRLSGNSRHLAPAPKQSIAGLPMLLLKLVGSVTFFESSTGFSPWPLLYIVIISSLSTSLVIQFNTNKLSISRLKFTSFVI
ncbi:uncharacterized mitochondrial protein AtMg00810-like [Rutidosis leptorrhynchoides]|uniref:uncharacterized mitochondrial protein AtMg00810-like n=1 Tax=Rutidosis leptorrhynchoides TaxID=125765 RepID=UPI003A99CF90